MWMCSREKTKLEMLREPSSGRAMEPLPFAYLLVDTGRGLTCENDHSLFLLTG